MIKHWDKGHGLSNLGDMQNLTGEGHEQPVAEVWIRHPEVLTDLNWSMSLSVLQQSWFPPLQQLGYL